MRKAAPTTGPNGVPRPPSSVMTTIWNVIDALKTSAALMYESQYPAVPPVTAITHALAT